MNYKFVITIITTLIVLTTTQAHAGSSSGLSSSNVESAGFSKLSESEKAEILKQVADKASTKTVFGGTTEPTEDKVDRWVKIGSNIGQGLAGAAKELNVAVNDFSKTPVGQLTAALIVWHMLGNQFIHIFGGLAIWLIGFSAIRFLIKRSDPDTVIYSTEKRNIFGNAAIDRIDKGSTSSGDIAGWVISCAIVLATGIAVMVTGG